MKLGKDYISKQWLKRFWAHFEATFPEAHREEAHAYLAEVLGAIAAPQAAPPKKAKVPSVKIDG